MTEEKKYKFSDEYKQQEMLEGERTDIKTLINKKIEIINFVSIPGAFVDKSGEIKNFLVVQAKCDDKLITFACGSSVVMKQLEKVRDDNKFPIEAEIILIKSEKSKLSYFSLK